MDLNARAASGPSDNAGKASSALDNAITAAIGAVDKGDEASVQSEPKSRSNEGEDSGSDPKVAGDKRGPEQAAKPKISKPDEIAKETGAPEAPKVFEAPKHWPEADRTAFAGLPDEAKAIVGKLSKNLEGGFTRKSQELSDKGKFADSVRSLFNDDDRQQMARVGQNEQGVISYLLDVQRFATHKPVEYMKWAMQNLGVSPDQIGFSQKQPQADEQKKPDENLDELLRDPAVIQMQAKLDALEKWKTDRERYETEGRQRQYVSTVQSIQSQIGQFRSSLDDDGQLKYPHFDTVQRHMGALMDTDPDLDKMPDGPAKLDAAYQMAVRARPDLYESMLEAEVSKRMAEEQKRAAAEKAKRASAVKPASGVIASKPSRTASLDEALSSAMSKYGL